MNRKGICGIRRHGWVWALVLFLALFSPAPPALAQEGSGSGLTLAAVAGYDGYQKVPYGVPVHVTVANSGPPIEGEVRLVIGTGFRGNDLVYSSPVSLPTQSQKRLSLFVHTGSHTGRLTVELLDDRGNLIQRAATNSLASLGTDELLYGVVGGQAGRLAFLERVHGGRGRAAVALLTLADLPEVAAAWNALDILIIADADTGQLTPAQLGALASWVETGGQLVVTGGANWQKNSSGLAAWLPVTVNGSHSLADLPSLAEQFGVPLRDPGPYLVAASQLRSGELLVHQDGLPLLARHNRGRGAVYFLALDPNLAPLRDWDGSPRLWGEIATTVPRLPFWARGPQNSYTATAAVESLPGLALPSVLALFAFLMVYVIVVGPLNYAVLRRLKRREMAWLTIPAIIITFSAAAYLTGFQLKGNDVVLNQMSVVYGRAGSQAARVHSLLAVYSPRRAAYDVIFPADALVQPFERTGNLGGGLAAAGGQIVRNGAVIAPATRIDVGGTATFLVERLQPPPALDAHARLRQSGGSQQLEMQLENNSGVTLENVNVIFGDQLIPVGDLTAGASHTLVHMLGSGAAVGRSAGPGPGYGSFFYAHYSTLLGTSDFYSDREVYPRFQLLESLAQGTDGWLPADVVTVVAWSDQPQLETAVSHRRYAELATSLYFIEVPVSINLGDGRNVTIPPSLITWTRLTAQTTIPGAVPFSPYEPYGLGDSPVNLYLPPGVRDFEYRPWSSMSGMAVRQLAVDVQGPAGTARTALPIGVYLWHWAEERWQPVAGATWGVTTVPEPAPFLGPGNAVRIRLQNDTSSSFQINSLFPHYTGDLE
jgi:hypothetical protein